MLVVTTKRYIPSPKIILHMVKCTSISHWLFHTSVRNECLYSGTNCKCTNIFLKVFVLANDFGDFLICVIHHYNQIFSVNHFTKYTVQDEILVRLLFGEMIKCSKKLYMCVIIGGLNVSDFIQKLQLPKLVYSLPMFDLVQYYPTVWFGQIGFVYKHVIN